MSPRNAEGPRCVAGEPSVKKDGFATPSTLFLPAGSDAVNLGGVICDELCAARALPAGTGGAR